MTSSYLGGTGREHAGRSAARSPSRSPAEPPPSTDAVDRAGVSEAAASVVRAANAATATVRGLRRTARRDADAARTHANAQHQRARQRIRETADGRHRTLLADLDSVVARLAPGALGGSWNRLGHLDQPVGILAAATHVRAGSIRPRPGSDRGPMPMIVPLLDAGNVVVDSQGHPTAITGVVRNIVLRALLGTGSGQLSLTTYDPQLRGTMAPFSVLRQAGEDLVQPAIATGEDLQALLHELTADVRRISEMYQGLPTTLGDFRRSARQPIERYRLIVLLDYPAGVGERSHELLRTLMRTGPRCGISFLVHRDRDLRPADGPAPADLDPLATVVRLDTPVTVDGFDGFVLEPDTGPKLEHIDRAVRSLRDRATDAAAPRIEFGEIHPPAAEFWQESSAERVTALIGRAGHQPVEITVGDEREQRHNLLVSGAVGQGKSNLLMVLVHSWAVRYPPDELELYLLDFKDGVTLYPLAPQADDQAWLPHARVLGLESDRSHGAAVLRHLVGEFERRAKIMRPFGDNITRFRAARPEAQMPRIVLVVDEFQVLFEEDDQLSKDALLDLERLAKKGRAYGIHLVLASQTLSGITAILSKQDGIFAQFPIRLALKNSANESRAVLDQHNTEAARLRYRGEIIVNTDFGQPEANRRAVVALADLAELRKIRADLVRRCRSARQPSVFNGGSPADLPVVLARATPRSGEPRALLGEPIGVSPQPVSVSLRSESGRHVSIVGTGQSATEPEYSAGAALLQTATVSLAWGLRPGAARFVVVNLLADDSRDQPLVDDLARVVEGLGHPLTTVPAAGFAATLADLAAEIDRRRAGGGSTPLYVVAFGLDRAPNLRIPDPASFLPPIDGLHQVWREGSALGVHLLGWWGNVRSYQDQLGLEATGTVDVLVLLRVGHHDVVDLLGPFVTWSGQTNRALVRDVSQGADPVVVIPFAPVTADDLHRQAADGRAEP